MKLHAYNLLTRSALRWTTLFACGGKKEFKKVRKYVIARRNDEAIANCASSLCTVHDCFATLAMTYFYPTLFPAKLKRGSTSVAMSG
jgi:hypothetical protein